MVLMHQERPVCDTSRRTYEILSAAEVPPGEKVPEEWQFPFLCRIPLHGRNIH